MELTAAQMRAIDEMVTTRIAETGESFDDAARHVGAEMRRRAKSERARAGRSDVTEC